MGEGCIFHCMRVRTQNRRHHDHYVFMRISILMAPITFDEIRLLPTNYRVNTIIIYSRQKWFSKLENEILRSLYDFDQSRCGRLYNWCSVTIRWNGVRGIVGMKYKQKIIFNCNRIHWTSLVYCEKIPMNWSLINLLLWYS